MTQNKIDQMIEYWEYLRHKALRNVEEADNEISKLLDIQPEESEDD